MSSVPALNARPSRAIERPATPPRASRRSAPRTSAAGRGSPLSRPRSRASASPRSRPDMAIVWSSLGRQLPPNPKLGRMYGRADPRVEPDRLEHRADVRAGPLRQAGQLVGERDLEGEERVGAVLDQLGFLEGDQPDRRAVEARTPRRARRARPRSADAVDPMTTRCGEREVAQGRALGEELGDREEARFVAHVAVAQESLAGPDGRRAADDRDRAAARARRSRTGPPRRR